ncbi:hypothetical protein ANRL1_02171 [Anaerolineae bacterium]|nr:hypothetical protein ANRL1_02171 [Anaerolineae bacterium]
MNPTTDLGELVLWDVPFAHDRLPAVSVLGEQQEAQTTLVVRGMGSYPGWIVDFASSPVVLQHDEMNSPASAVFESALSRGMSGCAFKWLNSPALAEYGRIGAAAVFDQQGLPMQHFVVVGGDWIVQILSIHEPSLQRFDGPVSLLFDASF